MKNGSLVAGLAVAYLLGCSSPPPPVAAAPVGSHAQTLLVLPLNVTAAMPPELDALSPAVWKELKLYLRAQGKDLKTVSFRSARRIWLESFQKARVGENGTRAGFDEAARMLVLALARHAEFDTVIAPNLFIQKAHILGKSASWDGVERAVEFGERGHEARSISANTPLKGSAPAASIHAVVLDAQGNKLQESKGGLELLVRVRVAGRSGRRPIFEFETRTDLFANREHVREGIAMALAPFLPLLVFETE